MGRLPRTFYQESNLIMRLPSIYHNLPRGFRLFLKGFRQSARILLNLEKRFVSINNYLRDFPNMGEFICDTNIPLFSAAPCYTLHDKSYVTNSIVLQGGCLRLSHASCFASSDIIQFANGGLWYELRDFYHSVHKKSNCSDGIVLTHDEPKWYEIKSYRKVQYLENGFFLSGIFSGNYYHFLISILPRLQYIDSIPSDVPLLVDKCVERISTFKQALAYCNNEHRPIIILDDNIRYVVTNLYLVTIQAAAQPNYGIGQLLSYDDDLYSREALKFVRDAALRHLHTNTNLPKRVFISRKNASGLRKFNERECIEALKPLGFEVIYPENLSFDDQVSLFNQADCIVGGSGAAFTNILFSSNKVKYIILEGYRSGISIFSSIASYVNANLLYIYDKALGDIPNGDYIHIDFCINPQELCSMVKKITST